MILSPILDEKFLVLQEGLISCSVPLNVYHTGNHCLLLQLHCWAHSKEIFHTLGEPKNFSYLLCLYTLKQDHNYFIFISLSLISEHFSKAKHFICKYLISFCLTFNFQIIIKNITCTCYTNLSYAILLTVKRKGNEKQVFSKWKWLLRSFTWILSASTLSP